LDNEDAAAEDHVIIKKSSMKHKSKAKRRKKSSSSSRSRLVEDEAELSSDDNNSSDDEDGEDLDNYEADGFVCGDDDPIVYDEELVAGKKRLKKEQTKSKRKHKRIVSESESSDDDDSAAVAVQSEDTKMKDLRNGLVKLQSLSASTATTSGSRTKAPSNAKPVLNKMSDIMKSRAVTTSIDNDADKENIDPITGKVVSMSKIKQAAALASAPLSVSKKQAVSTTTHVKSVKTTKPLSGQEAIERECEKAKASVKSKSKPKPTVTKDSDETKSSTKKTKSPK
jgi:hypothetical protein